MTYTTQAIQLAIENGWQNTSNPTEENKKHLLETIERWSKDINGKALILDFFKRSFFDPLFFQALIGWNNPNGSEALWKVEQHRLLDFINEGHSIEEFFKSVIENK